MKLPKEHAWIALTKVNGVGPVTSKLLISYCGSAQAVFEESSKNLLKIPNVGLNTVKAIQDPSVARLAEEELSYTNKNKIELLYYLTDNFPQRLKHFQDTPILLYSKGKADLNANRTLGIIGTRNPSEYGKWMAKKLVEDSLDLGVTTVSGLAHGVDALSHRTSVNKGIPTIAFMGGGFEKIYPAANRKLASEMISNGRVLTEFGFKVIADREHFPMRNRLIAALSDALIVVESGMVGGSIITADLANQYNKDVFAIPGKVNDVKSIGCNRLIKQHKANLLEGIKDVKYIMGWEERKKEVQMTLPLIELNDQEREIISIIKEQGSIHLDSLHHAISLPISKLSPLLLNLEFQGMIRSLPGKCYSLN